VPEGPRGLGVEIVFARGESGERKSRSVLHFADHFGSESDGDIGERSGRRRDGPASPERRRAFPGGAEVEIVRLLIGKHSMRRAFSGWRVEEAKVGMKFQLFFGVPVVRTR